MNKTTLEDRIEIKRRYVRGKGQKIADEWGISRQYVGQIVHNPKIQVPPTNTHKPSRFRKFAHWVKRWL